jgi:aminoglycoside phosphotransferase (APT) family kinase protein
VLDSGNPGNIIGVLDWEMATLGDPLMDLGGSLAYWVEKKDPPEMQAIRFMPTDAEGALTRDELVRYYAELSGRSSRFIIASTTGKLRTNGLKHLSGVCMPWTKPCG